MVSINPIIEEDDFICNCGCNLKFTVNRLGLFIHILDYVDNNQFGKIINETSIVGDSWINYLPDLNNTTIGSFVDIIKQNKDNNSVWKHLYNQYHMFDQIPQDKILSVDYIY